MRRIIERVVTVVTTTTWKISWEADAPHQDLEREPLSSDRLNPDALSKIVHDTQPGPAMIETKEVDPPEREAKVFDQTAEEPLHESYSYQTKIERKPKP